MKGSRLGPSTTSVHGVPERRQEREPVVTPIHQSTTFVNAIGSDREVVYTRYGNNPNQLTLARKYALLEGAEDAVFLASGMGATAMAHLAVLRPGDHLVASRWIYGGTARLFDQEFGRLGIDITYVNPTHPRSWRAAIRKTTRAIFLETPVNPTIRVFDLAPVARLAKESGVALLVDATFASPINFRPLEHGADVVITSATKYLNGHSDVIGGAVAGSRPVIEEVLRLMACWGAPMDPHAAWLVERGLKTLAVRMERHNANGLALATYLSRHPRVAAVSYPGLPDHPDHEIASRTLAGFGGMLGVTLKGGAAAADRFLRRLRVFAHAPSLGGVESLVSDPRFTSQKGQSEEQLAEAGILPGFLRLSCGIEDAEDLIADLEHGLGS
ncbi:MAG TPA: PLP-dependent aspartate aminotransferase family protein [Gemmatimonadales bacterium]|nr:PLP-dependent aspartate aminotransferase family protein [Gemmatimonadales bacterium]